MNFGFLYLTLTSACIYKALMLMEDLIVTVEEIDVCPVQIQGPKSKALMKDLLWRPS